jgi:hypothetical protein
VGEEGEGSEEAEAQRGERNGDGRPATDESPKTKDEACTREYHFKPYG